MAPAETLSLLDSLWSGRWKIQKSLQAPAADGLSKDTIVADDGAATQATQPSAAVITDHTPSELSNADKCCFIPQVTDSAESTTANSLAVDNAINSAFNPSEAALNVDVSSAVVIPDNSAATIYPENLVDATSSGGPPGCG